MVDLKTPVTTMIGSLPHHNIDAALEMAFQVGVAFLPQIPIRNPWEYMIAQALEGVPGLQVEKDGSTVVDANIWVSRARGFDERLREAFENAKHPDAFASFEPSAAASSSWQPFLWEIAERKVKVAKIQLAGPLTSQWALRLKDGSSLDKIPELSAQIYRLILARTLAMTRRLSMQGIQPVLYLDEPALYGISRENPKHLMGLQELKLLIQALRKDDVTVGLHCCSNTDWSAILELGIDILSLDTRISLEPALRKPESLEFVRRGGRFSFGIVPTSLEAEIAEKASDLVLEVKETFEDFWKGETRLIRQALDTGIYTPACGLALRSPGDTETILSLLNDVLHYL